MRFNQLLQNLFDCLLQNTTVEFYEEEDHLFKFDFKGEISPMNLLIISSFLPLISSYGYICTIYGTGSSDMVLRICKHD